MTLFDQGHYKLKLHVQDADSRIIYDLGNSGLIESIMWQTHRLASQPGSLEILVNEGIKDIAINPGSFVRFGINDKDLFYGNFENIELVNNVEGVSFAIVAYDHKKLLESVETRHRPAGMTGSDFFHETMSWFNARIQSVGDPGIGWAVREPSIAPLDDEYFPKQSLYSMFKNCMMHSHVAEAPNSQYMIRDNLGTLEWRELKALRTDYILGDRSFAESYVYAASLADTKNVIKFYRDNDTNGTRDVWTRYDSNNIRRWRYRQLAIQAEEYLSDAEISNLIDLHLAAKNRTNRTLKMTAAGIPALQAGDGIQVMASRAKIDHHIWIESCTHIFAETHMMELDLYI